MANSRKVDVRKKVSGLELTLTEESERPQIEFDFHEKTFKTMGKLPAMVLQKTSLLSSEDVTQSEQLGALLYCLEMILVKEDRRKFVKILEDEGVEFDELFVMYVNLIEAISATPLDESSSQSTGSKKKAGGKKQMGTYVDLQAAQEE